MQKIIITGTAGFIGSYFLDLILDKKKFEVLSIDNLSYASDINNILKHKKNKLHRFVKENIIKKEIDEIFEQFCPDFLINFAAETHVDNSIENDDPFISTNILGVTNLLKIAKKNKIKKFIQISTDEVYGSVKNGAFFENSPLLPNSPYSASKASGDLICRSYIKTFSMPIIIIRCVNNFGVRQFKEKFIPKSILSLMNNKKIEVYGNGQNIRDWIAVEDFAEIVYKILLNGKIGEIYNVGAGNEIKNIDLAMKILQEFNFNKKEKIEFIKDRLGHDFRYSLNFDKIKKEFNFSVKRNFDEKLKEIIEVMKKK